MATVSEAPTSLQDPAALLAALQRLRRGEPGLRIRDAAARLGVSEAELVAARCGDTAVRLDADWGALIKELPELGRVMALTRNESAVHEKVGEYGKVSVMKSMGLVLNEEIDLRIFLWRWHHGFAVTEDVRSGTRRSLQFFDCDGTAIHKIYLRDDSNWQAYEALIERHRAADQSAGLKVKAKPEAAAARPDAEIDRAALRARWETLNDVHDFHGMLQDLGVERQQAFRLVGEDFAWPLDNAALVQTLESARDRGIEIMVFVGSPGVIQIHSGPVQNLKAMGPWFNVLDPGFNLHLRLDQVAASWAVRKPQSDSLVTSLELFDAAGNIIATLFGKRKPGQMELESWRSLIDELPRAEAPA
ncbi:MAG: ChuX/HutX family heme-like substrate-binding protein [Rhodovibrionaceae bacterium]